MTKTDLRDDASLAAMRLERWPPSNWNGGRDAIGIGGRLRRNPQRALLTELGKPRAQPDLLAPSQDLVPPVLRFESIENLELPVSVPDELWRSRDTFKPQSDDEELPL